MAHFLGFYSNFIKWWISKFIHLFMLSADWFIMIHNLPSHHDIFTWDIVVFLFLVISYFSWSFLLEIFLFYSFFNKATFMFALLFCSIDFCLHLYYLFLDIYFLEEYFLIDFWDNNVIFHFKIFFFINLFIFKVMFSFYTLLELHEFYFLKLLFNFTLCIFLLYWRPIDYLEKVLIFKCLWILQVLFLVEWDYGRHNPF